ncbi:MAG: response regulator transcription factor [Pseudomonadota bacterium]
MSRTRTATILVVDDDPAVRTALGFALELEGFEVDGYPSGEALLMAELPSENACLVIDERLPGISGMDTLRQLRLRGVTLPAIFITSHPNPHFREQAAAVGVPILEKPLFGDALLLSIREALSPRNRL